MVIANLPQLIERADGDVRLEFLAQKMRAQVWLQRFHRHTAGYCHAHVEFGVRLLSLRRDILAPS